MKKRLLCILFALLLCFSFAGCSKEEKKEEKIKLVDIEILQDAMISAAPSLPETVSINSKSDDAAESFSYISDLDYNKVESFFICYANTPVADEIAVITVKDKADTQKALDSLKKHVEERISLFSTYAPEELERLENAITLTKDNYAALIICKDAKAVEDAFYKAVKE